MRISDIKTDVLPLIGLKRVVLFTLLIGLISVISIYIPYLTGCFIDSILCGVNALFIFSILFASAISLVGLKRFQCIAIARISRKLQSDMQKEVLSKISRMDTFTLENASNTELGMKLFRDIPNVVSLAKNFYGGLVEAIFGVIFALMTVFYSNWVIGVIFLIFLPINIYFILPFKNGFNKLNSERRLLSDSVFSKIFELIYVMPFLKSLAAESPYVKNGESELKKISDFDCKNSIYEANFSFVISIFLILGEYTILVVSGYLVYKKIIPIGNVVFYQLLFVSAYNSFSSFFRLIPMNSVIEESFASLHDLYRINDEQILESYLFPKITGHIRAENISFAYQNSNGKVIDKFSLSIGKDKLIGIFGVNGSGKTTLVKLLIGYLKPSSGEIFYDDIPLSKLNLRKLRESISCVYQETLLITGTIRDNVTLCNAKYSDEDVYKALKSSSLDALISRLPKGIYEFVGNGGTKLSGGEMQKLAISRAIIRHPKILILDEISNHLDSNTKQEILQLLLRYKQEMTVLIISHDKEILNFCDVVINVKDKKLCS